ncbi:MAG: hypothetical protein WAO55_10660 [Candidatus Manganitrophaceae bacterium]
MAILFLLIERQAGWAGILTGQLIKIAEGVYLVKDKNEVEHKIQFDESTQKLGEVKEGTLVEVDVDDATGRAKSIKVVEKQ